MQICKFFSYIFSQKVKFRCKNVNYITFPAIFTLYYHIFPIILPSKITFPPKQRLSPYIKKNCRHQVTGDANDLTAIGANP